MTPELVGERATPGSKQVKRKKGCEPPILGSAHKRRSTLSGGECQVINEIHPTLPQDTPKRLPSALKRMMDTRVRSSSTPPLRRRGSRKAEKVNPARKLTGQRNIVHMLTSKAEVKEKGGESSSEHQEVKDSCQNPE